jgi:hypothetical protein
LPSLPVGFRSLHVFLILNTHQTKFNRILILKGKNMSDALRERGNALENEYFRRKEQELIQKMKEKMAAEATPVAQFNCPKCDGKLVEIPFENLQIDLCDKCGGAWLDEGELEALAKAESKGLFGRLFR